MAEVKEAVKNLKTIGSELTIWENRLEVAKTELQKAQQARDALQAEIDKKTTDFNLFMSNRDADNKKERAKIVEEHETVERLKAEFQGILKAHQAEKAGLEQAKREFDIQKLRHDKKVNDVNEFITAVRRASGLLGV